MSENLFDQFRGFTKDTSKPPAREVTSDTAKEHSAFPLTKYEAFRSNSQGTPVRRLAIRPIEDVRARERVVYSQLNRIGEDGTKGKALTLIWPFMVVVVRGKNLHSIADAVDAEICEFIQQFDGKRHEKPADEVAPFIESMEFYYPKDPKNSEKS